MTAKVTSLRKVDWDSFRVNFFALFPPGTLDDMPATYIAAFRAPETDNAWLAALVQKHPNILAIDVGEIMRQVQSIIDRVSRAVEFVFLFTLAGGLLVLQAAIAATQDERRFDAAILRTLGASRRQLAAAQIAEFLLARRARRPRCGGRRDGDRLGARGSGVQDSVRGQSARVALRHRRRCDRSDARRLARHAEHRAAAAARGDPAA